MVLQVTIPEFTTMCMSAMAAFESINTCKGVVFGSLICDESAWFNDSRDEGVEVEAKFARSCQASELGGAAPSRQAEEAPSTTYIDLFDTASVSSSINPAIIQSSYYKQRRQINLDSSTTFLPYDDDDIFRSRQSSHESGSQCFQLCRLDRCQAFSSSEDSGCESSSNVHPFKRDSPLSGEIAEVRMVHWDELVEDSVVNSRTLE
jgi:hypothetical protein